MTPEAQRIAIAEACGWEQVCRCSRKLKKEPNGVEWRGMDPKGDHTGGATEHTFLPRYLSDLNAMHEAEKWMISTHLGFEHFFGPKRATWFEAYKSNLELILGYHDPIRATAAQRAEAFLRTLNLWKEATP